MLPTASASDMNIARSFRRRGNQQAVRPQPPLSLSDTDSEHSGTILWSIPVDNFERFVAHHAFRDRLTRGLVFVHNKRPMADFLIGQLRLNRHDISCTDRRLSTTDLTKLENEIRTKRPSRATRRSVVIIECDKNCDELSGTLGTLASAGGRRKGPWIRGHA